MSHRQKHVVDPATASQAADASPLRVRARVLAGAVVAAAVLAALRLYPAAAGASIHPAGPDMFTYIWQTRLVGTGSLAEVGTRPGLPVFGSVLSGFHTVSAIDVSLVVGLVMAIALGLAVAVALRLAFCLPAWSLGIVTFTIALWGGSIGLSKGYLANELSLLCIVVGTLLVALPGGHDRARMLGAFAAMIAAGLAHPGFLPFYALVYGVWLVLSLPIIIKGRRTGARWWEDGSVRALALLAAATGVSALVIFGLMGLHVSDVTNITAEVRSFSQKVAPIARSVGLKTKTFPILAVVGVIVGWLLRRPSARSLSRAGVAWALCSAGGAIVTLSHPSIPGHRALLVILPLPAAAGLGIAGIAWGLVRAGRRPIGADSEPRPLFIALGATAAVAAVAVACVLVSGPGLLAFKRLEKGHARGDPARLVGSYVATVQPTTPVIVFTRPNTDDGALSWRGREAQVRTYVPTPNIASTFIVVGVLGGVDGMTPEHMPESVIAGNSRFAYADKASWAGAGPALSEDAIVVSLEVYDAPAVWNTIARDPSRLVAPGLAVLRGPKTFPTVSVEPAEVSKVDATVRALACLLVLVVLGGGFAAAAGRSLKATVLDAIALAPAVGAVVVTLTGLTVALAHGDPKGPLGLVAVVAVGAGGYVLAWRARPGAELEPAEQPVQD